MFDAADNDLHNLAITFRPADTNSYHAGTVTTNVDAFVSDPASGTDLVPFQLENDPVSMPLLADKVVWLYGQVLRYAACGQQWGYIGPGDAAGGGPPRGASTPYSCTTRPPWWAVLIRTPAAAT